MIVVWTDYMKYKAKLRGFDLAAIENIVSSPPERYSELAYFEKEDVLHLAIADEPEGGSIEISPNITAELNDKGELIGIEILNASTSIRDSILESVQAKMLRLPNVQTV